MCKYSTIAKYVSKIGYSNFNDVTIKFLDSDRLIKMEEISQKQTESFVNVFATASFKCTQIEYHKNTKCIKSLYFEQIYN